MSKFARIVPSVLAGALVFAACGDSAGPSGGSGNTGDALSVAEADELAEELFEVLFSLGLTGGTAASVASPLFDGPVPSFAVAEPIPTTTNNCEGGGTLTVSGDVDGSASSVSFDIVENFNDCVVSGSTTDFTINGDPNVAMTGNLTTDSQTSFSMSLDIRGGIAFTTDDNRSGTCSVSIDIDGDFDINDLNDPAAIDNAFTVSGTFCGRSMAGF